MDRIDALKIFILVAETTSFTKAATISGLPRSTVSSTIKELERKFGARLFHRTTRQVHLTTDGEALIERSKSLVDEMEETENIFRINKRNISGKLTIDVPSRIGARVIAPALNSFFELYPDIDLVLRVTDRAVDLVHEGVDCAIRVGNLTSSSLIAKKLGNFEMINCVSPNYIAKQGMPNTLEELTSHYLIQSLSSITGTKSPFRYVDKYGEDKRVEMKVSLTVNHAETRIASAIAGLGIIQVPAYDVQEHIAKNQLQEILINYRPASKPVNALYPHRRHLSQRVQVFIEWFEQLLITKNMVIKSNYS